MYCYECTNQQIAERAFEHLTRRSLLTKLALLLTGHNRRLESLADVTRRVPCPNRHDAGLQTVAIEAICGSEGRCHDFDAQFRPLKWTEQTRWTRLLAARLQGAEMPPVNLIQVGGRYYVRDGHCRISVARHLGQKEIDAVVTVWCSASSDSEEAEPEVTGTLVPSRALTTVSPSAGY